MVNALHKNIERCSIVFMIQDRWRFTGALLYLGIGIALLYLARDEMFYVMPKAGQSFSVGRVENFDNLPRYVWCLACAMFGMSAIAFEASKVGDADRGSEAPKGFGVLVSYFSRYLIGLLLTSSLIFVVFSAYDETKGYLFYFATAPSCFVFGYLVDFIVQRPFYFINRWIASKLNA